jgi:hypothetical protein
MPSISEAPKRIQNPARAPVVEAPVGAAKVCSDMAQPYP